MGGIAIEDDVLIGPKVNVIRENHPIDLTKLKQLDPKIKLTFFFNFMFLFASSGQKVYLPSEESLRERKTPEWFGNAKLGIFVHWGLYSVPGWAKPDFSVDQVKDWKLFYLNN